MTQAEIEEIINSIKTEYAGQKNEFERILKNIDLKIDSAAESGASIDIVKVSLQEIKEELDKRREFAAENFENILKSFEALNEKQDLMASNSDLKIMFDVLAENVNNFSHELAGQKSVIDDVEQQFNDFASDNSRKEEIIQNITNLKESLEIFNRGFEASVMEINSNLRNISKNLMTMDVTEQNDIIKRELENIYLASNAILSSLEILDQKNEDLVKRTEDLSKIGEIVSYAEKINSSVNGLEEKIDALPQKIEVPDLSFDIERIYDGIQSIKNLPASDIPEEKIKTIEDKIQSLSESLSNGFLNYFSSVKDLFVSFNDDLNEKRTVVLSKLDENQKNCVESFNNLAEDLRAIDNNIAAKEDNYLKFITERFTQITDTVNDFKAYFNSSNLALESKFAEKFTVLEKLIAQGSGVFDESFVHISDKIDECVRFVKSTAAETDIKFGNTVSEISDMKEDVSRILDNLSAFASKNETKLVNFDYKFSGSLEDLKNDLQSFCANFETLKYDLVQSATENRSLMSEIVDDAFHKTEELINHLSDEANLFANKEDVEELSTQLKELNGLFSKISSQNADNIISNIENASLKIDTVGVDLSKLLNDNFEMVRKFIEDSKDQSNQNIVEISELSDNVKNLEAEFEKTSQALKQAFNEQIESLREYISASQEAAQKYNGDQADEKVAQKLLALESLLADAAEKYEEKIVILQNKISDYSNVVEQVSSDTYLKLDNSLSEIEAVKAEITKILDNINKNHFSSNEKFEEISTSILNRFEELSSSIEALKNDEDINSKSSLDQSFSIIDNKFDELKNVFSEISEDSNVRLNGISSGINDKFDSIKQEINLVNTDIMDVLNNKIEIITEEFAPLKLVLNSFLENDVEKILENIKSQIEMSYLNFSADMNQNLNENHDAFVRIEDAYKILTQKFSNVEGIINDLNLHQMSIVAMTVSEIEKSVALTADKTAEFYQEWKTETSVFQKKLENTANNYEKVKGVLEKLAALMEAKTGESAEDIKNYISVMVNNDDVLSSLDNSKSELIEKLNIFTENISRDIKNSSDLMPELKKFFDDLKNNNADLMAAIGRLGTIDEIAALSENDVKLAELLNSLHSKVDVLAMSEENDTMADFADALHEKIEMLVSANNNSDKLEELLKALNEKVDLIALSDGNEKIEELVQALNDKIDVLALSDSEEKIEEMMQSLHDKVDVLALSDNEEKIEEMMQSLHDKVDVLALSDSEEKIEEMMQSLHDKIDVLALSDSEEKIEEMVKSLHDKVDVLALSENDERIEEMVKALHDKVDILAASDDSQLYSEIQDIKNLILEQRQEIEAFDADSRSASVGRHLQDLLADISKIEKSISSLDFVQNASDIKDSVMNAILTVTDQITFVEETEEIKDFVEERTDEINKNLLDVKKRLDSMTNGGNDWDYSYTMQDIESDIAKLRIILNDISASSTKDEISEISQNIHKLASAVNGMHSSLTQEQILDLKTDFEKLNEDIISISSRTNKLLLTSDDSYRALTSGLDEFSRVISDLEERISVIDNSEINERLERKLDNIQSMVTSSANSDSVMREVMMYLGEWIDGTSGKIDDIQEAASDINSISKVLGQVRELLPEREELLSLIENQFEKQQLRIDRLEQKLEKVLAALEEKNSPLLENKIDNLEKQLSKISSTIEKLASYVDE